ncbi:hypothetical protein E2C01_013580 [Portunus trituberculatus]|uniref:Uncharacterized protein n=1 Tax=Portunus trituberculatus TaxID=210409 RepID=A0A5B7DHH8_PORTR|nr:hypothetical protein [Portunus trituberculatus]
MKGTLTLHSDRFRERSDITREPCGLPRGHQGTTKFELKSPSMHSVVHGHPTAKSEFRQAEIRQYNWNNDLYTDTGNSPHLFSWLSNTHEQIFTGFSKSCLRFRNVSFSWRMFLKV